MESIQEVLKWFKAIGFELILFIAGLAGAFVNLSKKESLTLIERITSVICGGLIANYLTPVFINFLDASTSISHGIAFILGYSGLKSVEYIIDHIHKKINSKK